MEAIGVISLLWVGIVLYIAVLNDSIVRLSERVF